MEVIYAFCLNSRLYFCLSLVIVVNYNLDFSGFVNKTQYEI